VEVPPTAFERTTPQEVLSGDGEGGSPIPPTRSPRVPGSPLDQADRPGALVEAAPDRWHVQLFRQMAKGAEMLGCAIATDIRAEMTTGANSSGSNVSTNHDDIGVRQDRSDQNSEPSRKD
jgi:hypothetical protein